MSQTTTDQLELSAEALLKTQKQWWDAGDVGFTKLLEDADVKPYLADRGFHDAVIRVLRKNPQYLQDWRGHVEDIRSTGVPYFGGSGSQWYLYEKYRKPARTYATELEACAAFVITFASGVLHTECSLKEGIKGSALETVISTVICGGFAGIAVATPGAKDMTLALIIGAPFGVIFGLAFAPVMLILGRKQPQKVNRALAVTTIMTAIAGIIVLTYFPERWNLFVVVPSISILSMLVAFKV